MSDTPQRYFPTTDYIGEGEYIGNMMKDPEGDWVSFSDYQRLEREIERMRPVVEAAIENVIYGYDTVLRQRVREYKEGK